MKETAKKNGKLVRQNLVSIPNLCRIVPDRDDVVIHKVVQIDRFLRKMGFEICKFQ